MEIQRHHYMPAATQPADADQQPAMLANRKAADDEAERIAAAFRELGWSNTAAGELAVLHIELGGPAL